MKVLLTGTTSSGKTTLINELKALDLRSVFIIDEIARPLLDKNPELKKDPHLQSLLFELQTQAERTAEQSGAQIIICDRGIVDNIAHARLFGQPVQPEWLAWAQTYDHVFHTDMHDISYELTDLQKQISTVEDIDWHQFRLDLNHHILSTLDDLVLPYKTLSGSVRERLQFIENHLRNHVVSIEGQYFRSRERK